jgi:hypothetical protein
MKPFYIIEHAGFVKRKIDFLTRCVVQSGFRTLASCAIALVRSFGALLAKSSIPLDLEIEKDKLEGRLEKEVKALSTNQLFHTPA